MSFRGLSERFRGSLFYVPMLYVAGAIVLAHVLLYVDLQITERDFRLPTIFASTVDSARSLLSAIASATITFAGIAFSLSILMIQIASQQFSPRVLYSFFRDPFSKRIMGIAVGTFTYCLLILRLVRQPVEENGPPIIPSISVMLAVALGVITVLAILAFINHSAHSMEVSEIVRRITEEEHGNIERICAKAAGEGDPVPVEGAMPDGSPLTVRAAEDGWVEGISVKRLLTAVPPGGIARLETGAGMFVTRDAPVCTIFPAPEETHEAAETVRAAIRVGRTRTMEQDLALGFRQLVDIALRALSPGINDPTTANEVLVHLGTLLHNLLMRDLPPRIVAGEDGRRLFRTKDMSHRDYVDLAFDQIRLAAGEQPWVASKMLQVAGMLVADLEEMGLKSRAAPVRRQATMILNTCRETLRAPDFEGVLAEAEKLNLA